jgi:hypothetical protein
VAAPDRIGLCAAVAFPGYGLIPRPISSALLESETVRSRERNPGSYTNGFKAPDFRLAGGNFATAAGHKQAATTGEGPMVAVRQRTYTPKHPPASAPG